MDDAQLFHHIIDQHKDMLYRICCAHTKDTEQRKDLYQEVLVHVWTGLGSFRKEAGLKTWLYRIAVNTCLTWIRGEQRRRHRFLQTTSDVLENAPAVEDTPSEADNALEHLYESICGLRPLDRMLVSCGSSSTASKLNASNALSLPDTVCHG